MERQIKTEADGKHHACPKCGNETDFLLRSQPEGDEYAVWMSCQPCGFSPERGQVMDKFGGTDLGLELRAWEEWDDAILYSIESKYSPIS